MLDLNRPDVVGPIDILDEGQIGRLIGSLIGGLSAFAPVERIRHVLSTMAGQDALWAIIAYQRENGGAHARRMMEDSIVGVELGRRDETERGEKGGS